MVNRKRSSSASNAEEKNENPNGMTVNGECSASDSSKQSHLNARENLGTNLNTRSKCPKSGSSAESVDVVSSKDNGTEESDSEKNAKDKGGAPALRTSARTQKRARRDASPPPPPPPSSRKIAKPAEAPEQVRTRRTWDMWSSEDKTAFFEALREYGKDFESIQHYLAQKNKKKTHTPQMTRNKDQVRHFYYRTWHKISKYLQLPDDIKKQTQELYGLINYGELRKKIGLDAKSGLKLNELVHTGSTTIRYKGKNLRVKTPVCRVLKKLNNVGKRKDDDQIKLPPKITIEFRPHNNTSWARVQSFAQNPRVKVTVSLQRRLSSVIEYLQRRWRFPQLKHKEQLQAILGEPLDTPEQDEVLRVLPQKDAKITLVSMETSNEMITCASVSLNYYRANVLDRTLPTKKRARQSKPKPSTNTPCDDKEIKLSLAVEDNPLSPPVKIIEKASASDPSMFESVKIKSEPAAGLEQDPASPLKKRVELHPVKVVVEESNSLPAHEVALRQLLALEDAAATPKSNVDAFLEKLKKELNDSREQTNTATDSKPEPLHLPEVPSTLSGLVGEEGILSPALPLVEEKSEQHVAEQMDQIRHGWTAADAGTMLIGELFLKMGSPSNLILEYNWEHRSDQHAVPEPISVPEEKTKLSDRTALKQMLSKLLHIASTTFSDLKKLDKPSVGVSSPCRCGHTCGPSASSTSKSNNARSPGMPRAAPKVQKCLASKPVTSTDSETAHKTSAALNATNASCGTSSSGIPNASTATNASNIANVLNSRGVFLVPSMVAPQSRSQAQKSFIPTHQQDKVLVPSTKGFKEQLDKLLPSHRKARARSRKSVVVQRELPLLPKKTSSHSMMTLRIVQSAPQLGSSFVPVMSNTTLPAAVAIPTNTATIAKVVKLSPTKLLGTQTVTLQPVAVTSVFASSGLTTVTGTIASAQRPLLGPTRIVEQCLSGLQNVSCISSRGTFAITPVTTTYTSSKVALKTVSLPTVEPPVLLSPCPQPAAQTLTLNTLAQPPSLTSNVTMAKATLTSSMLELSIPETSASATSSSPLSISSLLDISLPGCDTLQADGPSSLSSADKLLDITLGNSNSGFSVFSMVTTASDVKPTNTESMRSPTLGNEPVLEISQTTPSFSPNNSPFKTSTLNLESSWINGESADISLSSLLGHLESPVKQHPTTTSSLQMQETTSTMDPIGRLSNDVDTQLQCMLNENSIDYVAKFADLAAQIATVPSLETPKKPSSPHC